MAEAHRPTGPRPVSTWSTSVRAGRSAARSGRSSAVSASRSRTAGWSTGGGVTPATTVEGVGADRRRAPAPRLRGLAATGRGRRGSADEVKGAHLPGVADLHEVEPEPVRLLLGSGSRGVGGRGDDAHDDLGRVVIARDERGLGPLDRGDG